MKMMSRVLYVLLLAVLLLAPGAQAKSAPPGPGPAPDVRFPTFVEKTLSNGLRLVVIEQHEQPVISLRLVTKGGRSYEPEGKSGLAEAVASLLPKGTTTRSSQQIAEAIDFVGGNVGAFTGIEFAYATAAVTSDQLGLGFDLLADVVLHPTFPEDEVERWRRQALSTLQVQQQSGSYLASRAVERLVLGQHPYGRLANGTPESVRGLTREDFAAFHKQLYIPNGSILAIVGDVKAADAFARAESAFGKWSKGESLTLPKVEIPDRKSHQIVVVDKPDAVQSEIRLAQPSIAFRDPDLFVAEVYNSVTGGHAASRLYEEIRRKRGLSYGAQSFFAEPTQPGWFEATTFTKTESTVEALELALEVLRGLQSAPVPAAELDLAKISITGAFPLEIETAEGIADKVLEAMRFGYGREFLETYNSKISAVTAADVQRFAKERIHPDRMTIVLVGNASAFSGDLKKKLGEFETIPAAELDLLQADLRKPKAAQAVPAASDPKALELLRQAQAALGGKAFLEQKTQIAKGSGTLSPPGMPQPMPIPALISYRVYPDKERSEIQLPMGTMIRPSTAPTAGQAWVPRCRTTRLKPRPICPMVSTCSAGRPDPATPPGLFPTPT